MKNREERFVRTLPEGYVLAYHLNAKDKKIGIILNLVALGVLAAVVALGAVALCFGGGQMIETTPVLKIASLSAFVVSIVVYIVLHELVHGIAYKSQTGEKLTFGMSWSCAFCGVPNIFVKRRTAIIALVSPLIVFTLVFGALCVVTYFVHPSLYILSLFLLGYHLGGCSGDIYVTYLFAIRFKSPSVLMRDTGPEQYFYVKSEDAAKQ